MKQIGEKRKTQKQRLNDRESGRQNEAERRQRETDIEERQID